MFNPLYCDKLLNIRVKTNAKWTPGPIQPIPDIPISQDSGMTRSVFFFSRFTFYGSRFNDSTIQRFNLFVEMEQNMSLSFK
jgi:hypothetical protein